MQSCTNEVNPGLTLTMRQTEMDSLTHFAALSHDKLKKKALSVKKLVLFNFCIRRGVFNFLVYSIVTVFVSFVGTL
jgi:hypothetical protein